MTEMTQVADLEAKQRVRGPSLETLADVRRQARRLYAEFVYEREPTAMTEERLRVAITLLGLIKATLIEEAAQEQAAAEQEAARDPALKENLKRVNRQLTRLMGPDEAAAG